MEQHGRVALVAVSEMAVMRALQLAGNRVLGRRGRSVRGPMRSVDRWSIHVHLPVEDHELDALLEGAWEIPVAVGLPSGLLDALESHVRALLAAGIEFRREDLLLTLSQLPAGLSLPWESHTSPGRS